jgi:hypothetical protein
MQVKIGASRYVIIYSNLAQPYAALMRGLTLDA